jgi:hypothetical protein
VYDGLDAAKELARENFGKYLLMLSIPTLIFTAVPNHESDRA